MSRNEIQIEIEMDDEKNYFSIKDEDGRLYFATTLQSLLTSLSNRDELAKFCANLINVGKFIAQDALSKQDYLDQISSAVSALRGKK